MTPPKILQSKPDNGTRHFTSNSFTLSFDEYVVVKDADKNIIVSPPLRNKPEYITKGHGVVVRLKDTLQPNTTYLFQFNGAIVDYNEGNPIPTLDYVFSTGEDIDSMSLGGTVTEAMSNKAVKDAVSVMLLTEQQMRDMQKSITDTSIEKTMPTYMTRCDEKGHFLFKHIRNGQYHVVAIVDENSNMQVEPSESVAFTTETHNAVPMLTLSDSLGTAKRDTSNDIKLTLFTPQASAQRVTNSAFAKSGKAIVTTMRPMIKPTVECSEQTMWRLNTKGDTLTVWTLKERCDSLTIRLADSSGIDDTLALRWRQPKQTGDSKIKPITAYFNRNNKINYFDTLSVCFYTPQNSTQCRLDSAATVINLKDSSEERCSMTLDSTLLKAYVTYNFMPGGKYKVVVPKNKFHDIYGHPNDTISTTLSVNKPEQFGNLKTNVGFENKKQIILQLVNEKGAVVGQRILRHSATVQFPHIQPGKYTLRAIDDENANGKWDEGDFAADRQPESVFHYTKILDIRANWDFEEKWQL